MGTTESLVRVIAAERQAAEAPVAPSSSASPTTERRLARRAAGFAASPWSITEGLANRHPASISLESGAPSQRLVPIDRLREAAAAEWIDPPGMGYGDPAGYDGLRTWIATWMGARGVTTAKNEIVLTTGSQQGIDLIARMLLDPGDTVVVEGPTYIGALQVFDAYEADYLVIPMDAEGLDPVALAEALQACVDSGRTPPKLLYSVPTFQNPTGKTMGEARRRDVLAVTRRFGLLVVEDDPYGELRFSGAAMPSLRALDPDVVYLGTFSKVIAPGLRMGWMLVPSDLAGPLANAREVNDVTGERMSQRIVRRAADGFLDDHIAWLRGVYSERRDVLVSTLQASLPSTVRIIVPDGGFFVWLELPEGFDATALLPQVADHGVTYMPGGWFYPDRRPCACLRLSFASQESDQLHEAARRLGQALSMALGLAL